jgi:hypothetical protein
MSRLRSRYPFFAGVRSGTAPLLLWALHFAYCYAGVAIGCVAGWQRGAVAGWSPLHWLLGLGSAAALAAAAVLLASAWRDAAVRDGGLLVRVRVVAAALALVGIGWTSAPVLVLPLCHLN